MTDTPAEVAEALQRVDFDCPSAGVTLRDYIADLQSQLAAERERDGRDAVVTDSMIERAMDACCETLKGGTKAYFAPESHSDWRNALTAALKERP